jgi:hypothetical protein
MNAVKSLQKTVVLLAATALVPACLGGDEGEPAPAAPVSQPAALGNHPDAVATVTLGKGHTVDFFDFGTGVFITETAPAYTPSVLDKTSPEEKQNTLGLWAKLSGGAPAPEALQLALQRALNPANAARSQTPHGLSPQQGGVVLEPTVDVQEEGLLAAPNGCNNGCCDYEWLSTFSQCQVPYAFSWFLYNYGYSFANSGYDIKHFKGLVCAATGTSTWHVHIGSAGGDWTIAEAHYMTWQWNAFCAFGICSDFPATTSVNTSAAQHLHTYCGGWSTNL